MTVHKDYISKYPDNSEIYRNKGEDLKHNLQSCQPTFFKSKSINTAKVATIVLYKFTEILARKGGGGGIERS